jgi:hypothetical protein
MLRLACIAVVVGIVFGQSPEPWNEYHAIMWSTGQPRDTETWIERLREINIDAEQCTRGYSAAPFVRNNFGFYVENLVPELGFLNNRRAIYDADWQAYTSTRDKNHLVRKPCFHDPTYWEEAKRTLQALVRPYVSDKPLLYDLRDELSIGALASPMDYCFCPYTLREFRTWLQSRYSSLEALNAEWETSFSAWEDVEPMTTYEIKDRERTALANGALENYAPWADHREFMDITFASSIGRLREFVRELDNQTPVGIEGTQMPSAWGGYDLWRLSRVIDWVEPYDIANSREIFRSFMPPAAPILSTLFGEDELRLRRKLWWLLLHGDRGTIVWDDDQSRSILKSGDGLPVTDRGRKLGSIFADIKAAAPGLIGIERVTDPIAIHYSQASIRAHWMFDSREDRDTWPRRFSSYEATHSRFARSRDSFVRIVEDLGLQYNFVSYEQIESGELITGGYRVLLLPQSVAMSEMEAAEIEAFVRAGGTVIADNMTATMNEHCRRLPAGQLDSLFGIQRAGTGWTARPESGTFGEFEVYEPGIPPMTVNQAGAGRAVYLNINLRDYGKLRLSPPAGKPFTEAFRELFRAAGIEAPVQVLEAVTGEPASGVEVWRYRRDGTEYVVLMRNPEFAADSLKSVGYPSNDALEQPARLRIRFASGSEIERELDPWSPMLIDLREVEQQ